MKLALVNPNLVVQRNDPFTTGIVYMPISLAYLAGTLRAGEHDLTVVDAYAGDPHKGRKQGQFTIFGLAEDQVCERIPADTEVVFVYAINLTNHLSTLALVKAIKHRLPQAKLVVLENTQAVTAYALSLVAPEFYAAGADYVLTGEAEPRAPRLLAALQAADGAALQAIDGLGSADFYSPPAGYMQETELSSLPFPAWDLFPLENYWKLGFAHGPLSTRKYLPLLTSRGCPYPCGFCVVPATNSQKWRARTAANVVDEIDHFVKTLDVHEFHIEDLDPTISDPRIREICEEMIRRDLRITWKIAAGTKVETMRSEETIDLMARAGCRYISISPETGSPRLLRLMRKPFDLDHAVRMVKRMSADGIRSQACFVLGYPGETDEDLQMTWNLVKDLTRVGVDEIALFIITPVPGSSIHEQFSGYSTLSELNFSPTWRADFKKLSRFRFKLYVNFLLWKLRYHPLKLLRQPFNFLLRRFETKMEMVPYRALLLSWYGR
jgi:radical SAM superfamily enzyme YgiQ (UPF0313 family)